jgi:hypothetical protein
MKRWARAIKDISGRAYAAMERLRHCMNVCIMLTGTPLDNTCIDGFALLNLLHGRPARSLSRMRLVSAESQSWPTAKYLPWVTQMEETVTLRSFELGRVSTLPCSREIVEFELPAADLSVSNEAYRAYHQIPPAPRNNSGRHDGKDSLGRCTKLIQAHHRTYHPSLVDFAQLDRDSIMAVVDDDEAGAVLEAWNEEGHDQQTVEQWQARLQSLAQNENWRSP